MRKQDITKLGLIILMVGLLIRCGTEVDSHYTKKELEIDGTIEDWENPIKYLEKGEFAIGVANNEDYLYLCMVSLDNLLNKAVFKRGLTTWFDSEGNNNKKMGITFPRPNSLTLQQQNSKANLNSAQPLNSRGKLTKKINYTEMLKDFTLIDENKNEVYLSIDDNTKGIRMKLNKEGNRITCEMKLPLEVIGIENISDTTGLDKLGVGFELGEKQRSSQQNSQPQSGTSVGVNRQGRNRRQGRNNNSRVSQSRTASLDTWVKVNLDTGSENK